MPQPVPDYSTRRVLTMDFVQGRKITVMRVSVSILKQLTVKFRARGIDPRSFGIEEIGTYAALVTPRWRDVFEGAWGARIFDNYSLSEFKTPATQCESSSK